MQPAPSLKLPQSTLWLRVQTESSWVAEHICSSAKTSDRDQVTLSRSPNFDQSKLRSNKEKQGNPTIWKFLALLEQLTIQKIISRARLFFTQTRTKYKMHMCNSLIVLLCWSHCHLPSSENWNDFGHSRSFIHFLNRHIQLLEYAIPLAVIFRRYRNFLNDFNQIWYWARFR